MRRIGTILALVLPAALVLTAGVTFGGPPNEREVKPGASPQDKDVINADNGKLWVLDFRFKDPRMITVDVPGRGRKVCWYVWYQVTNNSKEPRTFIPDFEVVTNDKINPVFRDQVLPAVQEAIQRQEDPSNHYHIKNSVTIASEPIPAKKENADAVPVTGVAIWDNVDPETNNFSIYVGGLSNGWSVDDNKVVRRKTLQLNFRRLGDKYTQDTSQIHFVAPATWIYRADPKDTKE